MSFAVVCLYLVKVEVLKSHADIVKLVIIPSFSFFLNVNKIHVT